MQLNILALSNGKKTLTVVSGGGLVQNLVDGTWDFKSLEKDSLLSLDGDVLWPFDESGEISLWLNVLTKSESSWGVLEESLE